MFTIIISVVLFLILQSSASNGIEQNVTCPNVIPEKIDVPALDGLWYVTEAATDLPIDGNCTKIVFNHIRDSATAVSLRWVTNKTLVEYNGTASISSKEFGDSLSINFTDQYTISYSILTISYEHYALLYSCKNGDDGKSSFELWKLSRTSKLKRKHSTEIDNLLSTNNITTDALRRYINTDDVCFSSGTNNLNLPIAIMGSAIITVFRHVL